VSVWDPRVPRLGPGFVPHHANVTTYELQCISNTCISYSFNQEVDRRLCCCNVKGFGEESGEAYLDIGCTFLLIVKGSTLLAQ
jgi:hypothetical protein